MPSYETYGRVQQKHRTRGALKTAAADLLDAGDSPTVAQVADAAQVSRSTAYRYFPSREVLYAEVELDRVVTTTLGSVYAAADSNGPAAERLDRVVRADHAVVSQHQEAFRRALPVLSGTAGARSAAPRRPGNRLRYLSTAVAPVADQMTAPQLDRLVAALALCVGIESALVTEDICNLNNTEAEEVKRWAARALLEQALRESANPPPSVK